MGIAPHRTHVGRILALAQPRKEIGDLLDVRRLVGERVFLAELQLAGVGLFGDRPRAELTRGIAARHHQQGARERHAGFSKQSGCVHVRTHS
jgi:hypothetical protein